MARTDPTHEETLRLVETRERERADGAPDLRFELLVTLLAVGSMVGLWLVAPHGGTHWIASIICVLLTAAAMRVRFETPFGFTVATQLAFVPLVFALQAALLPLAVMVAIALALSPEIVRGEVSRSKLAYLASNSAFALGPAWVFTLAGPARQAGPLLLLAALLSQFAADLLISGIYLRVVRGITLRAQLDDIRWVWVIDCAFSVIGLVIAEQMTDSTIAVLAIAPLLGLLGLFAHERSGRLEKLIELNGIYRGMATLLGEVVEADDAYTGMHSQGVVTIALAVGAVLGLDADSRRDLEFAALLHDVGKIAIPKEIINKPGTLDAAEMELVKTHAAEGQRMLARIGGFMSVVGEIVRSHHERWDGGGYPDGLLGEAAPLASRIITCCDSWSAMRTDRPYRRALPYEAAVEEMRRHTGAQFDPRVAEALLTVVAREHETAPLDWGSPQSHPAIASAATETAAAVLGAQAV